MENPKIMSVTNYAKMVGVTRQRIQFLVQRGMPLKGVKYYYKTGEKTAHYILVLE